MRYPVAPILVLFCLAGAGSSQNQAFTEWNDYAGSSSGMQYSALRQIDKGDVGQLRQAWFYPVPGTSARFGYNPLIKDGMMYVLGEDDALVAIDAATGRKIWTHRAEGKPTDRGINYWESKDRSDRRLIFAANSYLQEVNAKSGVAIPSFGNDGRVSLRGDWEAIRRRFRRSSQARRGACSAT
jgi:quinoprotein glucose dehydrogenase